LTIFNEPDNKHILLQHVMYELFGHTDLQIRAKKGYKEKIVWIFSVFLTYCIQINVLKGGPNRKYNLLTDMFNLGALKWVGPIEKKTPIVFSRSNFNPLSEEDYS
jgi:hypothetical protein